MLFQFMTVRQLIGAPNTSATASPFRSRDNSIRSVTRRRLTGYKDRPASAVRCCVLSCAREPSRKANDREQF